MEKLSVDFWETEMGQAMTSTCSLWDVAIRQKRSNKEIMVFMKVFEAYSIAFKQMFGIKVYFERTENDISITDGKGNYYWFDVTTNRTIWTK